jgi:glycerophosphoryl diester phosphodiesterase
VIEPPIRGAGPVARIGHRGAAAVAPENSLVAIEAAAAHGLDAVELDVLRRPDGALVLAHGLPPPPGAPLLDDGLALAAGLGLAVQVDVKLGGMERGIVEALDRHGLLGRSFVSSVSHETLAAFAQAEPALPRSYTYPEDRRGVSDARLLRPAVLAGLAVLRAALPRRLPAWLRRVDAAAATLNWRVVSPSAVDVCHALGAAVYVWTVNDAAVVQELVEAGADGIISDDPRLLPRTLRP